MRWAQSDIRQDEVRGGLVRVFAAIGVSVGVGIVGQLVGHVEGDVARGVGPRHEGAELAVPRLARARREGVDVGPRAPLRQQAHGAPERRQDAEVVVVPRDVVGGTGVVPHVAAPDVGGNRHHHHAHLYRPAAAAATVIVALERHAHQESIGKGRVVRDPST